MNAQCPLRKYWVRTLLEGGDLQAQYKVRTSSSLWPLLFAAGLYQLGNIYGGCRRRFPNAKLGRNNLRVYLGADILNVAIRSPLSPLLQSVENSVIGGEVRLCECTPQWWVNYSGWRQHIAPIKVLFRGSSAYNCLLRTSSEPWWDIYISCINALTLHLLRSLSSSLSEVSSMSMIFLPGGTLPCIQIYIYRHYSESSRYLLCLSMLFLYKRKLFI